jgi:hypothetical protein
LEAAQPTAPSINVLVRYAQAVGKRLVVSLSDDA